MCLLLRRWLILIPANLLRLPIVSMWASEEHNSIEGIAIMILSCLIPNESYLVHIYLSNYVDQFHTAYKTLLYENSPNVLSGFILDGERFCYIYNANLSAMSEIFSMIRSLTERVVCIARNTNIWTVFTSFPVLIFGSVVTNQCLGYKSFRIFSCCSDIRLEDL